jgi:hypothetical protein
MLVQFLLTFESLFQEELNVMSAATGDVINPRQALRELEKALPAVKTA